MSSFEELLELLRKYSMIPLKAIEWFGLRERDNIYYYTSVMNLHKFSDLFKLGKDINKIEVDKNDKQDIKEN